MSSTQFADIVSEVEAPRGGITSRTLFNDDALKVVLFGFDAGQELSEHTATMPAVMHFLEREAELSLGEDISAAGPGTWVHMQPGQRHAIVAKTPVKMLLSLLKQRNAA